MHIFIFDSLELLMELSAWQLVPIVGATGSCLPKLGIASSNLISSYTLLVLFFVELYRPPGHLLASCGLSLISSACLNRYHPTHSVAFSPPRSTLLSVSPPVTPTPFFLSPLSILQLPSNWHQVFSLKNHAARLRQKSNSFRQLMKPKLGTSNGLTSLALAI